MEQALVAFYVDQALKAENAQEALAKIPSTIHDERMTRLQAEEQWRSNQKSAQYPSLLLKK